MLAILELLRGLSPKEWAAAGVLTVFGYLYVSLRVQSARLRSLQLKDFETEVTQRKIVEDTNHASADQAVKDYTDSLTKRVALPNNPWRPGDNN